ncbi:MAG TPA: DUF423 domain-containing protein [Flammeovirgaceae bacterium]|nr:DUF423 domain-containing protein [Flammeovirgaceae bacterium]
MNKLFILTGSALGALAVALGAFGAHALKSMLEASNRLDTYETAVKYHFYHALALILTELLLHSYEHKLVGWAGYGFIAGIVLFSGSLYLLCFTGINKLGAITPLGGLAFIAAWIMLLLGVAKS